MKFPRKLLIPLLIVIFVNIMFLFSFFSGLEHLAQDSLFRIRGKLPVSGDIVIVAVDDATLEDMQMRWPFPREYNARLIENLTRAGAREIIFDIEFTEKTDSASDSTLAVAAAKAGNVIFAGKHLRDIKQYKYERVVTPIQPILDKHLNWGIVNMPLDTDGFIRRYTLYETVGKDRYYSLGMAGLANYRMFGPEWQKGIYREEGHLKVGGQSVPLIEHNKALINLFGPSQTFKHYSYSTVLDDSSYILPGLDLDQYYEYLDNGDFRDKIVLVGVTIDEQHDKFPTAFSQDLMDGVEIHANFMEMVRKGNYLYQVNPLLFLLAELLIACLVYLLLSWLKPQLSAITTVILILLICASAYLAFIKIHLLMPVVARILIVILLYVAALVAHYLRSQKEKKFIKNAFQQYLAPELVNELLKHPDNLKYGGALRNITVLVSDIVSYTTYTEKHKPEETVQILREYLTEMVKTIIANGGIVDKFVGDEILALYGVPIYTDQQVIQACKTALDMRERLTQMQEKWVAEGREPFDIGIAISSGQAVVGNLGSEQIFDYTAIGDCVNLTARLEPLTRNYKLQKKIIISEFTYELVKDQVEAYYVDEVKVRGKDIPVKIYELVGLK